MTTLAALFADTSALDRQPAHVRYAPHARARKVAVMDDSSTDDAQLMLDYASGNARAFELLYARHRSGLYRYLMRHARDPDLANDLFQDVWGRVIANRSRYEPRAKFQTFLFTLAHNFFIDHCRRTAARPRGESIDSTDTEDSLAAPDELRPDIELERADDTARYRAFLATAIDVLGPERGLAFAEREKLAVYLVVRAGSGFESRHSSAFGPYLGNADAETSP